MVVFTPLSAEISWLLWFQELWSTPVLFLKKVTLTTNDFSPPYTHTLRDIWGSAFCSSTPQHVDRKSWKSNHQTYNYRAAHSTNWATAARPFLVPGSTITCRKHNKNQSPFLKREQGDICFHHQSTSDSVLKPHKCRVHYQLGTCARLPISKIQPQQLFKIIRLLPDLLLNVNLL